MGATPRDSETAHIICCSGTPTVDVAVFARVLGLSVLVRVVVRVVRLVVGREAESS